MIGGSGLTQVLATGTNVATATSNAGGGGFGLSVSATLPLARDRRRVDGRVRRDDQRRHRADGDRRWDEHRDGARVRGLGRVLRRDRLLVDGGDHGRASVLALVGSTAHVNVPGQRRHRHGDRASERDGRHAGGAGGVISIAVMIPTAVVGGGVTANFDGTLTAADHLTVTATASNKADAHTFVVSIGLVAGSAGAIADAEILSSAVTHALIGSDASVSVTNGITVDAHLIGRPEHGDRARRWWRAAACSGRRPSSRRMPRTTGRRSPRSTVA